MWRFRLLIWLSGAPFWFTLSAGLRESAADTFSIEVCTVDRRIGLLPPGIIEAASIYTVKAQLVNESQDDALSCKIIAGDR
jgi:hypothetical protein